MSISFKRVPALPSTLEPDTLYLVRDEVSGKLNFTATDSTGKVAKTPTYDEIQTLINEKVAVAASAATQTTQAVEKTTANDNDTFSIVDSVSGLLNKVKYSTLKSWLAGIFAPKDSPVFSRQTAVTSTVDAPIYASALNPGFSALLVLTGKQASADLTWNIVSSGSGLGASALRFTKGVWTGSPSMLINENDQLLFLKNTFGYSIGAGGAVTQQDSKSNDVVLNKPTGRITMSSESLASGATAVFSFYNSFIKSNSIVLIQLNQGAFITYESLVSGRVDGVCKIGVRNKHTTAISEPLVIDFLIIEGAVA